METKKNIFEMLNAINVSDKTEKKNGLTYLSWAWAWGELLKYYPSATYTIRHNIDGWNYFTDGRTAWVEVEMTIDGITREEHLAVMNYACKSLPLEKVTSQDVIKTIQRALTKAIARFGLGLYVYAGEDLPEEKKEEKKEPSYNLQAIKDSLVICKTVEGLTEYFKQLGSPQDPVIKALFTERKQFLLKSK